MVLMKCRNCNKWVKSDSYICPKCGFDNEYTPEEAEQAIIDTFGGEENFGKMTKGITTAATLGNLFLIFPVLIVGLIIFGVGIYNMASNKIKSMNYIKTTAVLSRCEVDEDFSENGETYYRAYYKYSVNNVDYEADYYEVKGSESEFKKEVPIRYDKNNPKKFAFSSKGWIGFTVAGFGITVVCLLIAFRVKIMAHVAKKKYKEYKENGYSV